MDVDGFIVVFRGHDRSASIGLKIVILFVMPRATRRRCLDGPGRWRLHQRRILVVADASPQTVTRVDLLSHVQVLNTNVYVRLLVTLVVGCRINCAIFFAALILRLLEVEAYRLHHGASVR